MDKWGFIYSMDDASAEARWDTLGTQAIALISVGVPETKDAPAAARKLIDEGAQLIELCGAFGAPGLAAVLEEVGDEVPVGAVFYGGDASTGLHKLFG